MLQAGMNLYLEGCVQAGMNLYLEGCAQTGMNLYRVDHCKTGGINLYRAIGGRNRFISCGSLQEGMNLCMNQRAKELEREKPFIGSRGKLGGAQVAKIN